MRIVCAALLGLAACAAHRTGAVVAQEDMKYVATADQGYTPKGHYSCAMETATGTNKRVRVCRYDTDAQGDVVNRGRVHDDINQTALTYGPHQ